MADVALVCGGSGSLGAAVVRAFLARGCRVVTTNRQPRGAEPPDAVRREAVDLSVGAEVEALWERLAADGEQPRWLVNCAGTFRGATVALTEPDEYRLLEQVNLETAWWSCRAAARRLGEGDAIVNVAARPALAGGRGAAAYAVTKAAVLRLTQVLSEELSGQRVRVNAVLPSVMDTPANRAVLPDERLRDAVATDDVAAVIAFLCSDGARAVSGAAVPVYGWA